MSQLVLAHSSCDTGYMIDNALGLILRQYIPRCYEANIED